VKLSARNGFAAGPGGEDSGLNDWFLAPAGRSREVIEESIASTGAIIMGRRTYGAGDDGIASALEQARAAAGTRNVAIGGGPTTAQGFVEAPDATHLRYRVRH
jgi:dihydrofolate reductase